MKPSPAIFATCRELKLSAIAMLVVVARLALAAPDESSRGFPQIQLPQKSHGDDAIAALGNKLPALAAFYKKSEQDFKSLLRRDHSLWLDERGRLFYICNFGVPPNQNNSASDLLVSSAGPFPYEDTFRLHSRAGASKVIYLDFDGHDASSTIWGSDAVGRPFDTDGSPFTFSTTERDRIQYIWQRAVEDFIHYDVDVTTEDPGVEALRKANGADTNFGIRVVIAGSSSDWYGSAGGVAYIGSFDDSTDLPCWVFPKSLSDNEKYIAEAISHEVGHTLGLNHDGLTSGTTYYTGHGNWAPIMGVGYYENIVQWSKGEYLNANNTQDDLAIMPTYGPPYRADDHGNTNTTATALVGVSLATNGIIERTTDVDFFSFQTGAGKISITATPAPRGPNLHIFLSLYNSAGTLIASTNSTDTSSGVQPVTLTNTLAAGTYYFSLDGIGSDDPLSTGYSDYSTLGQYTITGTLPADSGWIPTAAGAGYSWSDTANWFSNTIPLGADAIARVANNIVGDQTINLNTTVTLGKLFIGDANASHSFTLENGSGGSFIFQTTSGSTLISKTTGSNDTIAATVTLQSDLVISNTTTSDLSFTGAINGSGGLTKRGTGRIVLAGTNTYTGSTLVDGGTLALASTASLASTNLHLQSGAMLDAIAIAGGLLLTSNQNLGGGGAVLGDVTAPIGARVSPGSNAVPGTLSFSNNVILYDGATLKFDLASSTTPGTGINDLLVVASNLNLSGAISVDFNFLNQLPASPATYTLIQYAGTLTGGAANFSSINHSNRYAFMFDDSTPGEIRVQISSAPSGLVWKGDGALNRWDVSGATNWLVGASPEKFFQLDTVTFDDTGSNSPSVSLLGALMPVSVTVNSSSNYTFAGSGKISGDAMLTKLGTGTLTVNTTNDFTGAALVDEGTLKPGNGSALGSAAGATAISSGARLDLNAQNFGAEPVTAAGLGPDGLGAIINSSATAQSNALRFLTLSADTMFGGTGRWDIRANPTATFGGNNFALTKTNANEVWLVNVGASGLGNINVNQGVLGFEGSSTLGNSASTLTIESAGTLALLNADYNTISKKLVLNGGTFRSDAGNNIFSGTATLKNTNTFNVAAGLELQGAIDGTGGIAKTGAGTLSLTASNIYDGAALVNVGTLRAGNAWALGGTNGGTVIASNARLDVNAQNLGAEPVNVTGDGLGNAGAIVSMNTSAQNNALRFITLSGNTTFGGIGRWDIRANPTASLTGNNFNLTKTGPNEVWLVNVGASGLATVTISEGTLGFQGDSTLGNSASAISVTSAGTFAIYATGTNALNKVMSLSTARIYNVNGTNVFAGTASLSGSNRFDIASSTTLTMSNTLSGSGTLYKISAGTLIFAGANTYSGATTVSAGTLQIGNGGATGTTGTGNITNNSTLIFNRSNDFTTANLIVASGSVTKLGAGILTLSGANTYSNTTTISAGTLKIGNTSALGVTNAGTTIASGATLDVNGFSVGTEVVTVQGVGVNGNGAIINSGTAQSNVLSYVTLANNTTFGGTGDWDIRDPGAGGGSALSGAFSLTKVGANQIWLANLGSTSLGSIIVSNGTLGIQGTTTLGNAANSLSISNGAALAISETGANTLNKILAMSGGRINNISGANTFTGSSATLSSSNVFDIAGGTSLIVSVPLAGSGSLNKIGTGTLNLSANNGYTGPTVIAVGTLALGNSGAIGSSTSIEVDAGAMLDVSAVSGGFALANGRTLLGNGIVNGSVTINGTLSPGLSIGRLTFNNAVTLSGTTTMELSKAGSVLTNDSISVAAALTYGGALVVTHSGNAISAGDVFPLFNAASRSGSFTSTNLPTLPVALQWDTSNLSLDGTLRVTASIPATPPQILPAYIDGTNFIVQVQSELGFNYVLESTTNLTPPAAWSPVSTNTGTGGLLTIPTPWQSSEFQKFFRLTVF